MSRKNRPQFHEPVQPIGAGVDMPIEDTIEVGQVEVGDIVLVEDMADGTVEVGTVLMVDGPLEPVPLAESAGLGYAGEDYAPEMTASEASFGEPDSMAALSEFAALDDHEAPGDMPAANAPSAGAVTDAAAQATDAAGAAKDKASEAIGGAADKAQDAASQAAGALSDVQNKVQDKAQDMAQNVTQAAQDAAGKAQDLSATVADKAQDAAQAAADKAKAAGQKIADQADAVKTAASDAGSKSKSAVAGVASSAGMSLWSIIQRNPLQAILFVSSLVWLLRSNAATASQPTASVSDVAGDAAEKAGTVAGQVQTAASNLGSQVQTQAQAGAGWFSKTLQSNPLAIGAMGIVFGAGLGFAVPETSYEHKTLGKTRDALADKAQAAAQDLTQKVTTVAQTAVHEAIDAGKEEAKHQGLVASDPAPQDSAPQDGEKTQDGEQSQQ